MDAEIEQAANILCIRRMTKTKGMRLPINCRPTCLDDALAIQNKIYDYLFAINKIHAAWKCALPVIDENTADKKIYIAPIYAHCIFKDGSLNNNIAGNVDYPTMPNSINDLAYIEPEFAFCFAQGLPYREEIYSSDEIDLAYTTHMALELINSRCYADSANKDDLSDITYPEMLADHLINHGIYIGTEIEKNIVKQACKFNIHVKYANDDIDEHKTYTGNHPNIYPHLSIYWLVNFLHEHGLGIEPQQAIITGSYAGILKVPFDKLISIEYENIGTITTQFKQYKNLKNKEIQ